MSTDRVQTGPTEPEAAAVGARPEGLDALELDIHAADARIGAESKWARMREAPGLFHSDLYGGFYAVTRFEDVMTVLMKPAIYSSATGITLPSAAGIRSRHIPTEVDPPEHREYRALLSPLTAPDRIRQLEPVIRSLTDRLLQAIPADVGVDFVKAFSRPLPVHVSLSILGFPADDAALLEGLVGELHEEVATRVRTGAADRLTDYVTQALAARRPHLVDASGDVVSSILLGRAFGRELTIDEQVSTVRNILIGGFDTTSITLATGMWWLAAHPQCAERLREAPELIDAMGEEVVRFASPSTYLRREVTRDTQLGGTDLHEGDQVLVCFGAANLDPAKFDRPNEIRLGGEPRLHVGFGAGQHRCVGSAIAKLEFRIAFEEILHRFKSFRLDHDQPIRHTTGLGQGIISLPVIFSPA